MKICPNCHSQVDDECIFCSECGTPLPKEPQAAPRPAAQSYAAPQPKPTPAYTPAPAPVAKKSRKGLIALLISLSVVLLAGVVVAVLFLTGVFDSKGSSKNDDDEEIEGIDENTPEAAEDYADARYISFDAEALVKCIPEEAWEAILQKRDLSEDEALAHLQEWLDGAKENSEFELLGTQVEEMSDDDLEDIQKQNEVFWDGEITSAMECTYAFSVESEGETMNIDLTESFIEYDGEWYFNPDTLDSFLDGINGENGSNGGTPGTYPGFNEDGVSTDDDSPYEESQDDDYPYDDEDDYTSEDDYTPPTSSEPDYDEPTVDYGIPGYYGYSSDEDAIAGYYLAMLVDFDAYNLVTSMPFEAVEAACAARGCNFDQLCNDLQTQLNNTKASLQNLSYEGYYYEAIEYSASQINSFLLDRHLSIDAEAMIEHTLQIVYDGTSSEEYLTLYAICVDGQWYAVQ